MNSKNVYVIGLSGSKKLTNDVCKHLKIKQVPTLINRFADGEIIVRPKTPVRNRNVTVIQSTSAPVNENLMELLITIDSLKRSSAKSINVIIPYYGYARQDRKTASREPITSKLVANLLEKTGATRVSIIDIHSDQTQGFFEVPVDTIPAFYILAKEIFSKHSLKNLVIVSPDYGGVKRARKIAEKIGVDLVILDKRRPKQNVAEIVNVLGDVKGKDCIIADDMIDTGGTIIAASEILKEKGAKSILIIATHGIFSGNAIEKLTKAINDKIISDIYVTDSIESVYKAKIPRLHIVSLSKLVAEIIKIYYSKEDGSISQLIDQYSKKLIKK